MGRTVLNLKDPSLGHKLSSKALSSLSKALDLSSNETKEEEGGRRGELILLHHWAGVNSRGRSLSHSTREKQATSEDPQGRAEGGREDDGRLCLLSKIEGTISVNQPLPELSHPCPWAPAIDSRISCAKAT